MLLIRLFIIGLLLSLPVLNAQEQMDTKMTMDKTGHIMITPSDLKWVDGPISLPKGVKVAVLEGDMSKPEPFTVRAKMPANYKIPPHFHPGVEHVTVLSGSCYMGLGDIIDESKAKNITAGGFAELDPGIHHFFYTKEECEIQLHGVGPWGITYINSADDPRNVVSK